MKFILIILALLSIQVEAKTVTIGPPEGYTFFGSYEAGSELEKKEK